MIYGKQIESKIKDIVEGLILLYHSWVWVPFDTGAIHSFISLAYVQMLKLIYEEIETPYFKHSSWIIF